MKRAEPGEGSLVDGLYRPWNRVGEHPCLLREYRYRAVPLVSSAVEETCSSCSGHLPAHPHQQPLIASLIHTVTVWPCRTRGGLPKEDS